MEDVVRGISFQYDLAALGVSQKVRDHPPKVVHDTKETNVFFGGLLYISMLIRIQIRKTYSSYIK